MPILSIGAVICDNKLKVIDTYYKTVKPILNEHLSDFCKELTGITQEEIDNSDDLNTISLEIIEILNKYNIKNALVWGGGDFTSVNYDFKLHREQELPCNNIKKLKKNIKNIEPYLTERINIPTHIGLMNVVKKLEIDTENLNNHNALDDAVLLSKLFYVITRTDISKYIEHE